MQIMIIFPDADRLHKDIQQINSYLKSQCTRKRKRDDVQQGFYCNRDAIIDSMTNNRGLIALCDGKFAGYLTWHETSVKEICAIEVVEVVPSYRQHGVFKAMQQALTEKNVRMFVADYINNPLAVSTFTSGSWQSLGVYTGSNIAGTSYRLTFDTGSIPAEPVCPSTGPVIALGDCSVYGSPTRMEYFPIQVDAQKNLLKPLIYTCLRLIDSAYESLSKCLMQLVYDGEVIEKTRLCDGFLPKERLTNGKVFDFYESRPGHMISIFSIKSASESHPVSEWCRKAVAYSASNDSV